MPRFLALITSLSFLCCATGGSASTVASVDLPVSHRKRVVRQILPHNVRVVLLEGDKAKRTASGVVIASERTEDGPLSYVMTNAHAVDPEGLNQPVLQVLVDGRERPTAYPAEMVAVGNVPDLDLALVKVRGVELHAAELAHDSELELGDDVLVVAAPFGRALSLSGGMVSHVEWDADRRVPRVLKTDAPIGYGASGGGIYSASSGKLLAIVEGYRTARIGFAVEQRDFSFDVPMPGETFAAPVGKVRSFLEAKGFARLLLSAAARAVRADSSTALR